MIKGCEKKIIYLKDTGSDYFDEAYFIVKPQLRDKKENDIISEATKIVNGLKDDEKRGKKDFKGRLFSFLAGICLGVLVFLCVRLIF